MNVHEGHRGRKKRQFLENGLDAFQEHEVLELLLAIKEQIGQTLVMVTHDMKIAERADRIYRMDNGELSPVMR